MYKIFLWIPTKGWKQVGSKRNSDEARELAESFTPLEVKVTHGKSSIWYGGTPCMPNYDLQTMNNLDTIN